jgi:hypothetical protein
MNHDSPLRSANESDRTDRCDSSGVAPRGRIALEPTLMRGCMGVRMYRNERLPPLFAVYPNDSSESVAVHLTGSTRVTPPVDHPVEAFRRASCRGQGWRCKAPRPLRAQAGARGAPMLPPPSAPARHPLCQGTRSSSTGESDQRSQPASPVPQSPGPRRES